MMDRRSSLKSEAAEIRAILSELPESAIFDRMSLESRLAQVYRQIENLPLDEIRRKTTLTFRGRPVRGSRGISADFGSRAARKFSDAYSATVAGMKENLRYMGPIPDRASHELLIVGTAIGSFGFQFELPPVAPDLLSEDLTFEERAVEKIRAIMEVSLHGSDEEIVEIVEDIHPRAVRKISEFVTLVSQSDATCALEVGGRAFQYSDGEEVRVSVERLADENIKEFTESVRGTFLGVLPNRRNFEYQVLGADSVILGKLSLDIEEPDYINSIIGKIVDVKFSVLQVGQGRPRYTLEKIEDVSGIVR